MKNLIVASVYLIVSLAVGCFINLMFITYFINYGTYLYTHECILYWASIILHTIIIMVFAWIVKKPFDVILNTIKSKK